MLGDLALRRENAIAVCALAVVTLAAWAWVLAGAGMDADMADMAGMSMADMAGRPAPWTSSYAALMLFMWITMMIAMMAPSAAPAALLYATLCRRRETGRSSGRFALFLAGYLAIWSGFSVAATLAQWGLERIGLVGMSMSSVRSFAGAICLAAGLYQFAPVKNACLRHCQNPLLFFAEHWRPGAWGAFRMGCAHGSFCLGCCWLLMALLFVGGVMNPVWIAGLALYVALEKLIPHYGLWLGRAAGAALVAAGVLALSRAMA
jgi:predicted metal-binding membrane protein